jgi:hypothetical protein
MVARYGHSAGFSYINQPALFDDQAQLDEIIRHAVAGGVGLVIVDTLARAMSGDENSAEDMGKFVRALDMIRHATAAHGMVIHHGGKNQASGLRGSSALLGAVDVTLRVDGDPGQSKTFEVEKSRDHESGYTYSFALEVVAIDQDEDGNDLTTCLVDESSDRPEVAKHQKDVRLGGNEKFILNELKSLLATDRAEITQPSADFPRLKVVRDRMLREHLIDRQFFSVTSGETLTSADRNKLAKPLKALVEKGFIAKTNGFVWLLNSS